MQSIGGRRQAGNSDSYRDGAHMNHFNTHLLSRSLQHSSQLQTVLCLETDEYRLTWPLTGKGLEQAFRLRGQVFCKELKWVGTACQDIEIDRFDSKVFHLGVETLSGKLISYLRVHPFWSEWMLDTVFRSVLPAGTATRLQGTCEVSRLAVDRAYRKHSFKDGQTAASLLYQLLFVFCRLNGIDTVCMIISERIYRALRLQGLPCRLKAQNVSGANPDAPIYATLSWSKFITSNNALTQQFRPRFILTELRARGLISRY